MIARRKVLAAFLLSVTALLGSLGRADAQTITVNARTITGLRYPLPLYVRTYYDNGKTLITTKSFGSTSTNTTVTLVAADLASSIADKRITLKFSTTQSGPSLLDVENILGTFTGEQKFDVVIPATYREVVDDLPVCVVSDATFDCRHRIRIFRLRCR